MHPQLLHHYSSELQYIRELGGEFAQEFPKIASRLGLEGTDCADPYVERLLEGFAFMSARVQVKLDAEFSRFTRQLLDTVYPHYLSPTPSMTVVRFEPDADDASLAEGVLLDRGTVLRGQLAADAQTACEYRTARPVELWPLGISQASYLGSAAALSGAGVARLEGAKAGIRLELRTHPGVSFDQLAVESLPLFLRGSEELPFKVYEQLIGNAVTVLARGAGEHAWTEIAKVRPLGFDDGEALLPVCDRSFQGYRLIHEYFAFPERYLFVELSGLAPIARACQGDRIEVVVLLDRVDAALEKALDASRFELFCAPAINLFPRRADRIDLTHRQHEYHVVADRTRPLDLEVHDVIGVRAYAAGGEREQRFNRLYHATERGGESAFFTLQRESRRPAARSHAGGHRSSYLGSEVFISLVDSREAPYRGDLRQLALEVQCTNRDLPLFMPVGRGRTDFTLAEGGPVRSVRCVAGPTRPRPSWGEGETAWRLVSHLSLNYLSIAGTDGGNGAAALRDLLGLYGEVGEAAVRRQIDEIRSVSAKTVTRRMPVQGPISFGRGLEITVDFDETAYQGTGVFLLGSVLEAFFARYVSINSFTETAIRSAERGEIMRWPARIGRRQTL